MSTEDYKQEAEVYDALAGVDGPPSWPKVIGGIGLGYGALMLGCLGCGAVGMLMPQLLSSMMQQQFSDGMPPVLLHPPISAWASMGLSFVVIVLLIVASVTLILRKPIARPLHLLYGALAIVSIVVGTWIQMDYQAQLAAWVNQNPDTKYAAQYKSGQVFQYAIWGVALATGLAWPLFCLVWFGAVKRNSAEIAKGADQLM